MTSSPSTPAHAEQHKRWSEARARLWGGPSPAPKVRRPRPESPFVREVREGRERKAKLDRERFEQQVAIVAPASSPHWYQIVCEVAKKRGLSPKEITARSRIRPIVHARHECFWRMRKEIIVLGEPISLPVIGAKFGNLDHTTVLWGIKQHERRMRGECLDQRGGPGRQRKLQ